MRQQLSGIVKARKDGEDGKGSKKVKEDNSQKESLDPALGLEARKSPWFAEVAMVRYRNSEEVRVLREAEFGKEFTRRPNDDYWQEVEVI